MKRIDEGRQGGNDVKRFYALAEIRTRVPGSGGQGDIHYTTRARLPKRYRSSTCPLEPLLG